MKQDALHKRLLRPLLLLLLLCAAAHAQDETHYPALPNFHQVNAQLFRGAQPKAGGLAQLARLGVKTIINLRGADEHARAEEAAARELGLKYFNVALPGFSRPKDAAVARVLGLIADPQLQPVFVHCKRGADRTGTIIACYRIQHDNWPAKTALTEAKHYGLSWFERGMKAFVQDYGRRQNAPTVSPVIARNCLWPPRPLSLRTS